MANAGHAQQVANIGFKSVGRAAPLVETIPREYPVTDLARLEIYPENDLVVGPWRPMRPGPNGAAACSATKAARGTARPRPASSRCPSISSRRRISTRQSAVERQALFPLQQPVGRRSAARRLRPRRVDRQRSAAHRGMGLLRSRLSARSDREPVRFRDRARALRSAARGDARPRRPDAVHLCDRARRAQRPLHLAARPELVRGAVLQPDEHDPVAADRGVPDAHGAGAVPRRASRTRRNGRRSTAGPRASCAAGTITASRISRTTCS